MIDNESLVADLVAWVAKEPRRYEEVMESWRTSCPRLTIWEDAVDHGYLAREHDGAGKGQVIITPAGLAFIQDVKGR